MSNTRPAIVPSPNGPYLVKDLETLRNSKGDALESQPTVALCRCGQSERKPFCDGTHARVGFSDEKLEGRAEDKRDDYKGSQTTLHDNRGICSHAGRCTGELPSVFRMKQEPWIDPDGATQDEIIAVVRSCPSGALSYSVVGTRHQDQERGSAVLVSENGPYLITGGVDLGDVPMGEGASREHYALCRCGASKNKPFCDGTHWAVEFTDENN
jgi:CDGSH-type Zn-finger protein